jgi:hypothetical protein
LAFIDLFDRIDAPFIEIHPERLAWTVQEHHVQGSVRPLPQHECLEVALEFVLQTLQDEIAAGPAFQRSGAHGKKPSYRAVYARM